MASFEPRGNRVRAHINLKDVRDSKTFESKGAARIWATAREAEIIAGARGEIPDKTFGDLLQRYADKITPTKKGRRWELVRIGLLKRDPIALVRLDELSSAHVAAWRDRRLEGVPGVSKPVKGASVRREWNLCSSACSVAIGEWKWLRLNPFSKAAGAKRPKNSRHRDELILEPDLAALQAVADSRETPTYRQVMRACRFGIETAMRSGEIIYLGHNPERVNTSSRVAHLPDTKNGNKRDVPLSLEAIRLWNEAVAERMESCVWGLTDQTRDTHWRNMRDRAAALHPPVGRLVFHDSRHTAITRLAEKLEILELARMAGITDLKILMVYYNKTAASIALKLD
jgi:integrase